MDCDGVLAGLLYGSFAAKGVGLVCLLLPSRGVGSKGGLAVGWVPTRLVRFWPGLSKSFRSTSGCSNAEILTCCFDELMRHQRIISELLHLRLDESFKAIR